jgi:predicted TIM-barrel fold metal-dependent hydrolase
VTGQTAALRLILAGTLARHPDLQIILGHWGEMLVSFVDRADALTKTTHLERRVLDYITGNIYERAESPIQRVPRCPWSS